MDTVYMSVLVWMFISMPMENVMDLKKNKFKKPKIEDKANENLQF